METGKTQSFLLCISVLLSLLLACLGPAGDIQAKSSAGTTATFATVITVNSTLDPDDNIGTTCLTNPANPCTLRRAIAQARGAAKPVQIAFNIPTTDSGYNATLHIWKIQLLNTAMRYLVGQTTIDGSTQPGGRTTGPKIILVGGGTGQFDGLKLGETSTQNANEIRGLGFQMFDTHIYVNSASNIIDSNWFGLSDDGTNMVLRGGGEDDGSGNTGVSVAASISNNVISHNVFTGLAGVAAAINGNYTTFSDNYIGTIANGTVPAKETDPSMICLEWDWLGGSGISMSGNHNTVENNVIAGLRIAVVPPTIQADAIRMSGDYHTVINNKIGLDVNNAEIGVCGRGIYLLDGTEFNQITSNKIIRPGLSAISLNDTPTVSTSDANTLRSNVIKKITPWGAVSGNPSPEDAIQMTVSLPLAFRNFKPAIVTSINGKTVSGTSGAGSPCPNCIIELFLEDSDSIKEALQSVAVVNANASGIWTATLPANLAPGQGLRTTSTTTQNNTITGMSMGTTTGLSVYYANNYPVYIPLVKK